MNLKLAKLVLNYTAALRINESSAGNREHVPVRSDYCVDNHVLTFTGGSKVQEGETTRPAYAKLSLFNDTLTNGLLDIVFEAPSPLDSIDKTMTTSEFDMLMQQFCISSVHYPACRAALLAESHAVARCKNDRSPLRQRRIGEQCGIHPAHHAPLPRPQSHARQRSGTFLSNAMVICQPKLVASRTSTKRT